MNIERLQNAERFKSGNTLTYEKLTKAMDNAIAIAARNIKDFKGEFPEHHSENQYYVTGDNFHGGWNNGFWTGILWLCYEASGREEFKEAATGHIDSFYERIDKKIRVDHHDMGFLYSLSCVAAYKLTGNEQAKAAAIKAADHLAGRYRETGEFIQAWGQVDDEKDYRLIIDCLMNIPLLYWATEVTGDSRYDEIALKHYHTTLKNIFREDASSFHTFYFDKKTGEAVKGVTHQGFSDTSCWARGQSWGVYGIPLTNKYHFDKDSIPVFEGVTNYFLNRLPEDFVPYWDLIFTEEDKQPRDSSSAAIVICGILEMLKYIEDEKLCKVYENAAAAMMASLIDNYAATPNDSTNGFLFHSTYFYKGNVGVDECNIWGDYFYIEALVRFMNRDWKAYW